MSNVLYVQNLEKQLAAALAAIKVKDEIILEVLDCAATVRPPVRLREALAIQPDDSALRAWLGKPVARVLTYIGSDPYPKGLPPIARTYTELPEAHFPNTWEEGSLLYAPKGMMK